VAPEVGYVDTTVDGSQSSVRSRNARIVEHDVRFLDPPDRKLAFDSNRLCRARIISKHRQQTRNRASGATDHRFTSRARDSFFAHRG
jgi:hypothetical protein